MSNQEDKQRAEDQARAQFESIKEMVEALDEAEESDNEEAREEARETIQLDPLSVEVRSGWHGLGEKDNGEEEFKILLCWGGPAVQIIGELDDYNEPCEAKLQYQDWFIGWTDYFPANEDAEEIILDYCRQFYFGD